MNRLHEKIRRFRKSAGLTQDEVAQACGITRNAVTQWESHNPELRTKPSTGHLIIFCKLANIDLSELIDKNNINSSKTSGDSNKENEILFTTHEIALIKEYRKLPKKQKIMIESFISTGIENTLASIIARIKSDS